MRLATYNVEWFTGLFGPDNELLEDHQWSSRYNVTRAQQIAAIGHVFQAMDADAIMIIEAPDNGRKTSTVAALENFARHFKLRQNKAIMGFANDTEQEIALLFDPKIGSFSHDPLGEDAGEEGGRDAPRFDGVFRLDVNIDDQPDKITFSKPPLELAFTTNSGKYVRLIGVHAKSKAPHGARNKREVVQISIANRRKQLAQCIWIRQRVDQHLKRGDPLIVMGDFNDGPGLDEYEELFGHSGVEIVLGQTRKPDQRLHDPHAEKRVNAGSLAQPTTARFYNRATKSYLNALLDYVMLSQDLFEQTRPTWQIWHPFDNAACFGDAALQKALLTASDHFPVTVDLDL